MSVPVLAPPVPNARSLPGRLPLVTSRGWQVRLRTTFADMDSSSPSTSLATCEYYCHVLAKYTDQELKAVLDVATGRAPWRGSNVISNYKEIQVPADAAGAVCC